ncbi:hypothetical protein WNY51_06550 [Pseudocolwellia sp. AS88]|uniref:hypothetical protein n=1 Tax=Pseudocolwellia sp. AS88 TaxID=3063958 RepID=UPI0026EEF192|nr:hypothetical protein [Pseudocolwellia sp. AS88]MDO7083249.1 hypothetical protein [Pseudocolwellia sp. AS88]
MKVKIIGFELEIAKNISIGEFFQQLETIEGKEIPIYSKKHILFTDVVDNFICGLILTYKTNKKSLATQKDSEGDLIINKSELKAGEHGTEVCVFCLNPSTNKGLLYSYNGSASPTSINELFRKQHEIVRLNKIKDRKNQLTDFGKKHIENVDKKAREMFWGQFSLKILVTPSDLDNLLPKYQEIHKIVLRADNALDDAGCFTPIEPMTKKAHLQLDLHKDSPIKEVKRLVKSIFLPFSSWKKEQTLRLIGLSHSGDTLELAVGDNQDNFGKIGYDDYVDLLPSTKWKNYTSCPALMKIIKETSEQTEIFGVICDTSWKLFSAKDYNAQLEVDIQNQPKELQE